LFYHLERQPLERVLPVLLEKSLERSWRCVVQAASRERVEALGGSVRVRSAPGSGCRITLTIPTGKRRAPGRQLISKTKLI